MLKRHSAHLRQIAIALDVLVTLACFALAALWTTGSVLWHRGGKRIEWFDYATLNLAIALIWSLLLSRHYQQVFYRFSSLVFDLRAAARTVGPGCVLLVVTAYFLKMEMPRTLLAAFAALDAAALIAEKWAFRAVLSCLVARRYNTKNILIVGTGEMARAFARRAAAHQEWGLTLIGHVEAGEEAGEEPTTLPVLGSLDRLVDILHSHPVHEVIFAVPLDNLLRIVDALRLCELEGVSAHIVSDLFQTHAARIITDWVYGMPLVSFVSNQQEGWQLVVKRLVDVLVSATVLVLFSPALALIAVLIKVTSPGPVFYPWKVVGRNKHPFVGYKFRTMVTNADELKQQLFVLNEMNGPVFKVANDPRVTPLGKWLRKYSLDEMPQLWSVLKGDMSLVGPRPPLQSELLEFDIWQRRKLSVTPGLLCFREVNGRSDIKDFDEWCKLDLEYIDNWSLWLDFVILAKAVPAVLSGRGAR